MRAQGQETKLEYDEGEDDLPTLSRPVIRAAQFLAAGAWQGVYSGAGHVCGVRQVLFTSQR